MVSVNVLDSSLQDIADKGFGVKTAQIQAKHVLTSPGKYEFNSVVSITCLEENPAIKFEDEVQKLLSVDMYFSELNHVGAILDYLISLNHLLTSPCCLQSYEEFIRVEAVEPLSVTTEQYFWNVRFQNIFEVDPCEESNIQEFKSIFSVYRGIHRFYVAITFYVHKLSLRKAETSKAMICRAVEPGFFSKFDTPHFIIDFERFVWQHLYLYVPIKEVKLQ